MALTTLPRRIPFVLVVGTLVTGCLTEPDILIPATDTTPPVLGDGWDTATPAEEGLDPQRLSQVYERVVQDDLWQVRSLLVFRNGRLLAEHYFKDPEDIRTRRAIWSATKQVVGVLVGIAVDQGVIASVHDPIERYLTEVPRDYPDKMGITIEDLLEMRSGIAYSNEGASGQTSHMLRRIPANSLDYILSLPLNAEPGTVSAYTDGNPHLLSLILQRITGVPLDEWADEHLFRAIGFTNYDWARYRDGSTLGGFGILTTPRETARIAQLVLDDGRWKGSTIVSPDWIAEMTAPRVESYTDRYSFGYQWWYDNRYGFVFMNGHGGQYAFIDRPTRTMLVMTAEPNTQDEHQVAPEVGIGLFLDVLGSIGARS